MPLTAWERERNGENKQLAGAVSKLYALTPPTFLQYEPYSKWLILSTARQIITVAKITK